jgi:hypothetical protein
MTSHVSLLEEYLWLVSRTKHVLCGRKHLLVEQADYHVRNTNRVDPRSWQNFDVSRILETSKMTASGKFAKGVALQHLRHAPRL